MSSNCRDCPACTRPGVIRASYWLVLWPVWAAFMRPFLTTCRGCHDMLSRHQRRADGSFRD